MSNVSRSNYILLALSQTMVSIGIVCSKYLLTSLPVFVILELRFAIATILLVIASRMLYRGHNIRLARLKRRDWIIIITKALCAGFFFNTLMLVGMRFASASVAAILTSTLPAVVALMSFFILNDRLSQRQWICIGCAVLGIMAINISHFSAHTNVSSLIGDFLIILALIPEASYYILVKLSRTRMPGILLAALINGINAIVFFPFLIYDLTTQPDIHFSPFMMLVFLISGAASGLFYTCWYIGSKNVPVSIASLFTAVMPIATIIIASVFLGETLYPAQFIGMVLIIGSIVLGARKRSTPPPIG